MDDRWNCAKIQKADGFRTIDCDTILGTVLGHRVCKHTMLIVHGPKTIVFEKKAYANGFKHLK